jgi:predicted kinase
VLRPDGLLILTARSHTRRKKVGAETVRSRYRTQEAPYAQPVSALNYPQGSLLVIAGAPAIGKTTLIERALPKDVAVLCPDLIRLRLQTEAGVEGYDQSFWPQAFAELHARLDTELAGGRAVVVHATGIDRLQQQEFTSYSEKRGRSAHIIFLDATEELCAAGLSARENKIPPERMKMYLDNWSKLKYRLLGDSRDEDTAASKRWTQLHGRSAADDTLPRRKTAIFGTGMAMMRARGFKSVAILNRKAVNTLQAITFG